MKNGSTEKTLLVGMRFVWQVYIPDSPSSEELELFKLNISAIMSEYIRIQQISEKLARTKKDHLE